MVDAILDYDNILKDLDAASVDSLLEMPVGQKFFPLTSGDVVDRVYDRFFEEYVLVYREMWNIFFDRFSLNDEPVLSTDGLDVRDFRFRPILVAYEVKNGDSFDVKFGFLREHKSGDLVLADFFLNDSKLEEVARLLCDVYVSKKFGAKTKKSVLKTGQTLKDSIIVLNCLNESKLKNKKFNLSFDGRHVTFDLPQNFVSTVTRAAKQEIRVACDAWRVEIPKKDYPIVINSALRSTEINFDTIEPKHVEREWTFDSKTICIEFAHSYYPNMDRRAYTSSTPPPKVLLDLYKKALKEKTSLSEYLEANNIFPDTILDESRNKNLIDMFVEAVYAKLNFLSSENVLPYAKMLSDKLCSPIVGFSGKTPLMLGETEYFLVTSNSKVSVGNSHKPKSEAVPLNMVGEYFLNLATETVKTGVFYAVGSVKTLQK